MQVGDNIPTVERTITQSCIEKYAEASGDFNPIHVDRDFASTSRFGRTIAHGMMIAAIISESMGIAFQKHWAETGKLKIRFKAPVFANEIVTAIGQVKSISKINGTNEVVCSVTVHKHSGETVITGETTVSLILP